MSPRISGSTRGKCRRNQLQFQTVTDERRGKLLTSQAAFGANELDLDAAIRNDCKYKFPLYFFLGFHMSVAAEVSRS